MGGPTCADEVGFSPRRRVVVMGETEMGSISSVLRERFGAVSAGGGLGRLEEGDLGDRGEGDGEEEGFGYGLAFYAWVEEAVELPGELEELNGAGDAVELLQVPQGFLQDYFNHQ